MPFPRRLAAACLAIGLTASAVTPAYAESRTHRLHRQQQRAAALDAKAHRQAEQVASMRQRLQVLNAAANKALEKLQQARLAADKAQAQSDAAKAELAKAQTQTDKARATLSEMAAGAYRTIAGGGALGTTLSLVETGNAQTCLDGINVIGEVGKSQGQVIDELRIAEAVQVRAERAAAAAAGRAAAAEKVAGAAKAAAARLAARQHDLVAQEQSLLSGRSRPRPAPTPVPASSSTRSRWPARGRRQ